MPPSNAVRTATGLLFLGALLASTGCRLEQAPDPVAVAPALEIDGAWEGQAGWFSLWMDVYEQQGRVRGRGRVTASPLNGTWQGRDHWLGLSANGVHVGGNWRADTTLGIVVGSYRHPEVILTLNRLEDGRLLPLTELHATFSDDLELLEGSYRGGPLDGEAAVFDYVGDRPLLEAVVSGEVYRDQVELQIDPGHRLIARLAPDGTLEGVVTSHQVGALPITLYRAP